MSKFYSSLREDLIRTGHDKEYRHAYAEEQLNLNIATQIKVLREQRDITQEAVAEEAGMKQSMISRYEDVDYSSWSINTLRKLAKAFDVYLEVRFRSFREMVESAENLKREALQVPKFTEDPYFMPAQPAAEPQRVSMVVVPGTGTITIGANEPKVFTAIFDSSIDKQTVDQITHVGSAVSAANPPELRPRLTG